MIRVVLLVVLAGVGVGCKSSDQQPAPAPQAGSAAAPPASAPTAGAGKVLEVSGQVTLAGKPVTVGQTLAEDDLVETGDDGRVTIELTHNLAHWQLGPGKRQKVSESIAWKLPRNQGNASVVIQDMTSAGRPAERSAADTVATAPATPAPPAPVTASSPPRPTPIRVPRPPAAPAPPPPDLEPAAPSPTRGPTPREEGAIAQGGPGGPPRVDQILQTKAGELHGCMDADMTLLKVHVEIAGDGTATVTTPGSSERVRACAAKVIATLTFPAQKTTASIVISR
ncbi:MAG TPA: hypothetical protein VMJ10_01520 [Kofleriaceae bacterium]|nr:hypothetical protein [Kofleriaceae bacterium]